MEHKLSGAIISNPELPITPYPGSGSDFNSRRLSAGSGKRRAGVAISAGCGSSDAPAMSDDVGETGNNQSRSTIDIGERFKNLIFDKNLKCTPAMWSATLRTVTKNSNDIDEKLNMEPYPSDSTLALLALKTYSDNPADDTQQKLPEGWELLTIARNTDWFNGYFGAAFLHRDLQQVVVAHRGTIFTNAGALWADAKSIAWNKETRHVCSAITFTEEIATALNEVKEEGVSFQLSITGHSLGGWLAPVTAFTVKYLQRDELTLKLKLRNVKDSFHAHTVGFESPGCKRRLSKMEKKLHLPLEITKYSDCIKILDISSYLSAPNLINSLNEHLGIIYRIKTNLSDMTTWDRWSHRYTSKTHSMEKMHEALEGNLEKFEMLDWPLIGGELKEFQKDASLDQNIHLQTKKYVFKDIDKKCCSLRIFSEEERCFLDWWEKLIESKMNLTNLIEIKGLTASNLLDKFQIDKEKQTIVCASEESVQKVIRHTKALMRWAPAEVMAQVALLPSAAEAMFHAARDHYLRSLWRSRVDLRDIAELEAFLSSDNKILIIRTQDSSIEMARLLNIFSQIQKKRNETIMYTNENNYSFIDLNGIKTLESPVNLQSLFQYCFTEDYLFFLQCIKNCKDFETILKEILTNLKSNPTNKLVFVESHDTGFEALAKTFYPFLEIENNLILKHTTEINLNNLTEESLKTIFEQKNIILQGEKLSLREFVGEYHHLTADQLNNVNALIGPQTLKNILFHDNYVIEMEDALINQDDLRVHSTLNTEVSLARVARALRKHSGDALLVISGIGREELGTGGWRELASSVGEENIFTTTEYGEPTFKQMCREKPDSTVYWLAASAGHVYCKTIYEKGFYMKRQWFYRLIFNIEQFANEINDDYIHNAIFIFQNIEGKQLMSRCTISEEKKNIFLGNDYIKTAASDEESDKIITENLDRPVHVLKQEAKGGQILWQRSRGSLEGLRPYVIADTGELIDEEHLCKTSQKVAIIADEPGMGKSTSLTSISRLLRSAWVIRVDLKDFQIPVQNLPAELSLNSISEFLLSGKCRWLQGLLRFCLDKQNTHSRDVYFLFDGFDEIKQEPTKNCAEDYFLRLFEFLNNKTTARILVTTRLHKKEMLENALSVFAMHFESISESQQREYLVKFWRPHLRLEMEEYGDAEERNLKKCAENLYIKAKNVLGDDVKNFMGIPLQMRMLAEVFMQQVNDVTRNNIAKTFIVDSVFSLYQQFINHKYEIYFDAKTNLNVGLSGVVKNTISEKITDHHRTLSFSTLFPTFFKFSKRNFNDIGSEWLTELSRVGLVQSGRNGSEKIEFIHRTLAEFFCADVAADWMNAKGWYHGNAPVVELLSEILLLASSKVIRIFLNYFLLLRPLSDHSYKYSASKMKKYWNKINKSHQAQAALKLAAHEGHHALVEYLVKMGAEVNCTDENGRTALSLAACCGHNLVVELLVDKGADINSTDKDGRTALSLAARWGHNLVVELLIDKGANVNSTNKLKWTALSLAAQKGHNLIVELLIRKGADVNSTNTVGRTALSLAAQEGHNLVVELLIDKGTNIDSKDIVGLTALSLAAQKGRILVVELLLDKGANINSIDREGRTALSVAAQEGHNHVVLLLFDKGADINSTDKLGWTALFMAAQEGHILILEFLIDKGADVNSTDNYGRTALSWAAYWGQNLILELLVDKGTDINSGDKDGRTALSLAAQEGHYLVMELLVDKVADINSTDKEGRTALFLAASRGHCLVVELLINKGADINSMDDKGRTPASMAALMGHDLVVKLLINKMVAVN